MIVAHRTPSPEPAVEANVDLVLRFYEIFSSDDPLALPRAVAPGWTIHPPAPGMPQGIAGYQPVLTAFRAAFPDCAVTVEDAFGAADRVVVRATMRATHRGTFLDVPASGKPIELRTCDIHRVEGGAIVQSWHIEDLLGFVAQATGRS